MTQEFVRYYTRGVRFPRLVGRTHDGTPLPGGPYTVTQLVGGLAVFVVGSLTMPAWETGGALVSYLILLGAVVTTIFLLRFVRNDGRNPVTATMAVLSVLMQPRGGRFGGRPLRIKAPHRVTGRVQIRPGPGEGAVRPLATPDPDPRAAVAPGRPRLATGSTARGWARPSVAAPRGAGTTSAPRGRPAPPLRSQGGPARPVRTGAAPTGPAPVPLSGVQRLLRAVADADEPGPAAEGSVKETRV